MNDKALVIEFAILPKNDLDLKIDFNRIELQFISDYIFKTTLSSKITLSFCTPDYIILHREVNVSFDTL